VWHELVLHGIGGRTIEEAKDRISHAEFVDWCAYISKRGSLNSSVRAEQGTALLAHVLTAVHGRKTRIEDFIPKRDEEPEARSIQDVFKMLKSVKKAGDK
jgi:hypothetical protein